MQQGSVSHPATAHRRALLPALLKVGALALGLNLLPSGSTFGAAAEECRITVLGDSLSSGYGLPGDRSFPRQLEVALVENGFECEVIDAGVSGDTSAGGRARVAWALADAPSHLLVELGGNDALRALPVDQLERNLEAIIETATERDIPVFLAGMLAPPNLGTRYTDAFASVYSDLAERHEIPLYTFFLEGVITRPAFMQPDGIHPAEEGVAEIVRRIVPPVTSWLKNTGVEARSH
jgi:acyl-CoA thioesterase I